LHRQLFLWGKTAISRALGAASPGTAPAFAGSRGGSGNVTSYAGKGVVKYSW
jgi:hypothetical protein